MLCVANERARDAAFDGWARARGTCSGRYLRELLIALTGGALGVLLAYAGVRYW